MFTLDDLAAQIEACPPGGAIGLPYELFADLNPDTDAQGRAFERRRPGCTSVSESQVVPAIAIRCQNQRQLRNSR
jgi:hypothetical protein